MAHHSSRVSHEINAIFRETKVTPQGEQKLGATGRFPEGKLVPEDEGETLVAIGSKDGKVVIDLGKPTAWIGFTPDQADAIADTLRRHADAVRGGRGA